MKTLLHRTRFLFAAILFGMALWLGAAVTATPAQADLPPRPTAPTSTPGSGSPSTKVMGGWIELHVQNVNVLSGAEGWSVVQWQDVAGNWQDVNSWRGAFDDVTNSVGIKTWWVNQATFSATPFRWVVYDPSSNKVIAQSAIFHLPTENHQKVAVDVTLGQ